MKITEVFEIELCHTLYSQMTEYTKPNEMIRKNMEGFGYDR